jgi:hypothetical protein
VRLGNLSAEHMGKRLIDLGSEIIEFFVLKLVSVCHWLPMFGIDCYLNFGSILKCDNLKLDFIFVLEILVVRWW